MQIAYYILTFLLVLTTILPRIHDQHWFFRVWDFGKVQLLFFQLVLFILGFIFLDFSGYINIILQGVLLVTMIFNIAVLIKFTPVFKIKQEAKSTNHSKSISIISINVYQFNDEYSRLIDLVKSKSPDILLTMESNKNWDLALSELDSIYKNVKKIPLENTYGMHFYTNLHVEKIKVNYFMSDDIPSIQCSLKSNDGWAFEFFGIHPPPPSPTEEETSKERDGELLSVAKVVKELKKPIIVSGDFNNVAWAKSSLLFKRVTQLIDPRVGRGFVSTFHAKKWYMRFPIDLFFHSKEIFIEEFKTLDAIGSDHFPLYCKFTISDAENPESKNIEKSEPNDTKDMNELIEEGKKENGDRDTVATE